MTLLLNLAFIQKPQKPLTDEGLHKSSQEESTLSINGKCHSTYLCLRMCPLSIYGNVILACT